MSTSAQFAIPLFENALPPSSSDGVLFLAVFFVRYHLNAVKWVALVANYNLTLAVSRLYTFAFVFSFRYLFVLFHYFPHTNQVTRFHHFPVILHDSSRCCWFSFRSLFDPAAQPNPWVPHCLWLSTPAERRPFVLVSGLRCLLFLSRPLLPLLRPSHSRLYMEFTCLQSARVSDAVLSNEQRRHWIPLTEHYFHLAVWEIDLRIAFFLNS